MMHFRALALCALAAFFVGCGEDPPAQQGQPDAEEMFVDVGFWDDDAAEPWDAEADGGVEDAGGGDDTGVAMDTGVEADAGDAGAAGDGGAVADGGDAGPLADAGVDAGQLDAGQGDAGPDGGVDAAVPDAGQPAPDGGTFLVTPAFTELPLGSQVTLEAAAAAGSAVVWSVDGVAGGDAVVGTVVPEVDPVRATYTAPLDAPLVPVSHTVGAALGAVTGAAQISLVHPVPTLSAVTPAQIDAGAAAAQLIVTGSGFVTGTRAYVDGFAVPSQRLGWSTLQVDLPSTLISVAGARTLRVVNSAPGGGEAVGSFDVILRNVQIDPTLPPTIVTLFDGATVGADPNRQPLVTYPEHQAVAPHNFPAPQVSWDHPGSSNACRMRIASPTVAMDVYVTVPNATDPTENTSASHSAAEWNQLSASNLADHDLTVTVACGTVLGSGAAATLENNTIFVSTPVTYTVGAGNVAGRIVYFSGLIEGLWRIDLGQSVATGQPFAGPGLAFPLDTTPQCLGCHSFSFNGQQMAYIANAVEWNVGVLDVSNGVPSVAVPAAQGAVGDWTSMHPTDPVLLSINLSGQIVLNSASTGQIIDVVPTAAAGNFVTHPVWSPLGDAIAFVSGVMGADGVADVAQGQIWSMPVTRNGAQYVFGPPTLRASPAVAGGSAYYPAFSPDGQWILYSQSPSGSSYDNLNARVGLVKADGTVGPLDLGRANQQGALRANSWPRWAPQIQGSTYWIVFSSQRPYGPFNGTGPQQLWVSRLDMSLLPADPSAPAVWLPGQEPFTGNLTAEWTVDF
ncbi:MAG: PD40 domain-containing protein [Deltaproteobacteria bacterium]|nr:PD40 domain-containing protein [Deltaproteobacteria bacterium]